jgi:hypothetical protein
MGTRRPVEDLRAATTEILLRDESLARKALREAVAGAGSPDPAGCATAFVGVSPCVSESRGYHIRTAPKPPAPGDVQTSMISIRALNRGPAGVRSAVDAP